MHGTIKVTGGVPLIGEVVPISNKNAIVSALPVSILTDQDVVYNNVPNTTDVQKILQLLRDIGADVGDLKDGRVVINCKHVSNYRLDSEIGGQFRASIMFAGPLLARFGVAEVPIPGGCVLGRRSISAHIDSFAKVGVKTEMLGNGYVRFTAPKSKKGFYRVWQLEASVTATENLLMYVAGSNMQVEITGAASEPHVADLELLLVNMGATINGIGSNIVTITGQTMLSGAEFYPGPDFVDIAGYFVAAAVTKGHIRIKGANQYNIVGGILNWFRMFNIKIDEDGEDLVVSAPDGLFITHTDTSFPSAGVGLPKLAPRPWPGFPVDALPIMVTLASKTKARMLIQNWMFESGLDFYRELNSIGADIFMADPQRLIVTGPVVFKGGEIVSPSIIQACKALFLASLADPVVTTLHRVDILRRRYPVIFESYKSLGANIEVLG